MIDIDQGGEISLEELRDAMKSADVGITKPEMEYMFRKVTNFSYCRFNCLKIVENNRKMGVVIRPISKTYFRKTRNFKLYLVSLENLLI